MCVHKGTRGWGSLILAKSGITPVSALQSVPIELSLCVLDEFGLWGWNPVLIELSGKCARDSNRNFSSSLYTRNISASSDLWGQHIWNASEDTWRGESRVDPPHHENQWLCQQLPAMACFFFCLLMGNDRQMSQRAGVGPVYANANVKRKLCLALKSMCSGGKERKEAGGGSKDKWGLSTAAEMGDSAAAAPRFADTSGAALQSSCPIPVLN